MLRLKEIELLGFKSFADRTRLVCDGSTAAVVGPNGCGKSNLSDALSWVLGEQSARMLRGERMSDVIFNGTGTRPPTGMAEVSIVLVESGDLDAGTDELEKVIGFAGESGSRQDLIGTAGHGEAETIAASPASGLNAPAKPVKRRPGDEIKVTRRLFRSGESEYLLNGELCRLRDIQDIFMGTGLGPESYAIIEQGRIGQILSSKPSDRRSIIEEAAGVSKFKSRKRLAEAKLESSRQNLSRINDILEEISKQVNSLKRQASKAARYKELHQDLRARQKRVITSRLLALEAECERLQRDLAAIQEECSAASSQLESLESGRNLAAARYEQLEEELKQMREALAQSELESERTRSRLEKARQQAAVLETRAAEAAEERARLDGQARASEQEAAIREQHATEVREEWSGAQQVASQLRSQQSELTRALASQEAGVEAQRREMFLAVSRASEIRNQAVKADEMSLSAGRELARSQAERAAAEDEYHRFQAELEALRAAHVESETALSQLSQSVALARAALDQERKDEAALRAETGTLSQDFSQASARKQAIEESLARHAYSTDSVRRLLSASTQAKGFHPLGVLADFLEVSPGYEEAVEEFLRTELECVVVERHDEARSGIALLEREGSGRSTFFVRDFHDRGEDRAHPAMPDVSQRAGVVAPLGELVRFEARLGLNGTPALPALARSFVVEDAAAAQRLAAEFPSCHFITPNGEHYHHRYVSGGKISNAGPLALRRDFRDLDRRTSELQTALAEAGRLWSEAKERLERREAELQRLSAGQMGAEKRSMLASEKLRQADESTRRAEARIHTHEREAALLMGEREKAEQLRSALQADLETARLDQEQKEKGIAEGAELARRLRLELDQTNLTLTGAQVKSSALEERWRAAEADRSRVAAETAQARDRLARLVEQSGEWQEEQRRLEAEGQSAQAALDAARGLQQSLREQMQTRQEESQGVRARRDELIPQIDAARAQLEAHREKRSEVEVAQARAGSGLDHHRHQCREELGAEPDVLRAGAVADELLEGEPLRLAEEEVHELKGKLERLGPVNMMALEELQEAEERLTFLDAQRQDLLASINDTTETIREIDVASQRKFMDAFTAINGFFAESFRALFGGGVGEMRFSGEADPESGIDLVAQPPGKRLQNVLLLSGGEKALTALALLIAVFRFSPSPFCILDEVDAPLDEANVVRFARMIQQMSEQTQFILITHNRRTMEACRMMYGVTMEEAGVSRLVSVRFEATQPEPQAVGA
ncbi:MAG: chromosome segregation protein SMC [Terriglobia bacterium]